AGGGRRDPPTAPPPHVLCLPALLALPRDGPGRGRERDRPRHRRGSLPGPLERVPPPRPHPDLRGGRRPRGHGEQERDLRARRESRRARQPRRRRQGPPGLGGPGLPGLPSLRLHGDGRAKGSPRQIRLTPPAAGRRIPTADSRQRIRPAWVTLGGERRRSLRTGGGSMASGRPLRCLAVFVCLGAATGLAFAQTTGNIDGRVTDSAGAPPPGVTVEATSPSLQGARAAVTGSDGVFRLPSVPPGRYRVAASLPSFRAVEIACTVSLDSTVTVELVLRLETEEQVVVSGEAPSVDVASTTTGTTYRSGVVSRLPVSRHYADIPRA